MSEVPLYRINTAGITAPFSGPLLYKPGPRASLEIAGYVKGLGNGDWHGGAGGASYLRLIDSCITQLKAQGPSRTCNESKEEEACRGLRLRGGETRATDSKEGGT